MYFYPRKRNFTHNGNIKNQHSIPMLNSFSVRRRKQAFRILPTLLFALVFHLCVCVWFLTWSACVCACVYLCECVHMRVRVTLNTLVTSAISIAPATC
ncbi:hypothetical protein FKM82_010649 [Ascaphus truei]